MVTQSFLEGFNDTGSFGGDHVSKENQNDVAMLTDRIQQLEETLSRLVEVIAAINQRIPDDNNECL